MGITVTVIAANAAAAEARVRQYEARAGILVTGPATVHSERHHLWTVPADLRGPAGNAWLILTSYGMTPKGDAEIDRLSDAEEAMFA